jgi:hypothetical protein
MLFHYLKTIKYNTVLLFNNRWFGPCYVEVLFVRERITGVACFWNQGLRKLHDALHVPEVLANI